MILLLLIIMLAAGAFGGLVNVALRSDEITWRTWATSIVAGVGAALLTPLFLRTVSSELLSKILGRESHPEDLLVFGGFCLLTAISSKAFIETLSSVVLQQVREASKKAETAAKQVRVAQSTADMAGAAAQAANDAVEYGLGPATAEAGGTATVIAPLPEVQAGPDPNDPWSGQFGGQSTANGRRLEASISPMPGRPDLRVVRLTVRSTDPAAASLAGRVKFFLHPTFGVNHKPVVTVINGEAHLSFTSWGAFTVGVLADGGQTRLELDLSKLPDADEPWRSR